MLSITESEPEEEIAVLSRFAVFDAAVLGEPAPEGFEAVRIPLDGTLQGKLDWSEAKKVASGYCAQGLKIVWDLDLGLFCRMVHPLAHQGQFQSFVLALEHFRDTLWKEFRTQTAGLIVYRGSGDLSQGFPWDEGALKNLQHALQTAFPTLDQLHAALDLPVAAFSEVTVELLQRTPQGLACLSLFCRDVAAEYLELLAQKIPDSLPRLLLFDMEAVENPVLKAQLLNPERFPSYLIGAAQAGCLGGHIGWKGEALERGFMGRTLHQKEVELPETAICLPSMHAWDSVFSQQLFWVFTQLKKQDVLYRVIPESQLTASWEGLNVLYVFSRYTTSPGKRMIAGFKAAGGTIVDLQNMDR